MSEIICAKCSEQCLACSQPRILLMLLSSASSSSADNQHLSLSPPASLHAESSCLPFAPRASHDRCIPVLRLCISAPHLSSNCDFSSLCLTQCPTQCLAHCRQAAVMWRMEEKMCLILKIRFSDISQRVFDFYKI